MTPLHLALPLLLSAVAAPVAAQDRADALPAPAEASRRSVRELANLEIQELALERDIGQADLQQVLSVMLYVGAVGGAIASVALALGTVFEAICVDGDIDDCLDGPSYIAGAIPTALVTATLFIGATLYQRRVDARRSVYDERRREIHERRQRLEHDLGLALGPTSIAIYGAF